MTRKIKHYDLSSFALHILAMLLMLSDHMWASVLPSQQWMTIIGRMAYPIFAFMIVEGFFHTHDLKKYMLRLLVFAVLSEIPFNLLYGDAVIYPYHQNVLWTFLVALSGITLIDLVKKKEKQKIEASVSLPEPDAATKTKLLALFRKNFLWRTALVAIPTVAVTALIGQVAILDFFGAGVLMVYIFYFFHGRKWWCFLGQLVTMYYVNVELGGLCYNVTLFGHTFEIVQQAFALGGLLPIWLYKGRQGYHGKWFRCLCYAFYPVHSLLLVLIVKLFVMH